MLKNILIVVCIGTCVHELQAAPVPWIGTTSSDLTVPANWTGGVVPTAVGSSVEFNGTGFNPTLSTALTLGSIDFPVGITNSYIFQLESGSALSFPGAPGVTNNSAVTQNFLIGQAGLPGASLIFPAGAASTGPVNYTLTGANGSPSQLLFQGVSAGSGSNINLEDYSFMQVTSGFDVTIGSLSGTSLSSVNVLGTGTLEVSELATTTYSGTMNLAADATLFVGPQNNLTLAGPLLGGNLAVYGNLNFANGGANPLSSLFVTGVVNLNHQSISAGLVSGTGAINLGVSPSTNLFVTDNSSFDGSISGAGGLIVQMTAKDDFVLSGPNTYTGATNLLAGELSLASTGSLNPQTVLLFSSNTIGARFNLEAPEQTVSGLASFTNNPSTVFIFDNKLTINQTLNSTFGGSINSGSTGYLIKTGNGLLNLTGASPEFSGQLLVSGGSVAINNEFGNGSSSARINGSGILKGTGTFLGNVTAASGGTIQPGNSVGTLTVLGNTAFEGGTFSVEINDLVGSSLLNVSGTTSIIDTGVQVIPSGAGIGLNRVYPILNSGTLSGTFDGVTLLLPANPAVIRPELFYVGGSVSLEIIPTFSAVAVSANERAVAALLDPFVPTTSLAQTFLGALITLPTAQVLDVLDELSGNQHTVDLFATSVLSRNFLRRLYDPIRDMVTTLTCNQYEMDDYSGIDTWAEGGFDRHSLRNDGNGFGYNLSGWEVTFGFQSHMSKDWVLGFAGSYVADTLYYNLGGHGDLTGGFAGFYALYRPDYFYALGNLAFGYTQNHMFRKARAGSVVFDAESRPEISEWCAYAEAGVDLPIWNILIQPFAGIEGFTSSRNSLVEDGASTFNLVVNKKDRATAASRLGLHITTMEWFNDFSFSLDAAWVYQLTTTQNNIRLAFNDFGPEFTTHGIRVARNSVDGAFTIQYFADETVQFYGQFAGEVWNNSTAYSVLAGVELRW